MKQKSSFTLSWHGNVLRFEKHPIFSSTLMQFSLEKLYDDFFSQLADIGLKIYVHSHGSNES